MKGITGKEKTYASRPASRRVHPHVRVSAPFPQSGCEDEEELPAQSSQRIVLSPSVWGDEEIRFVYS